MSDKEMLKKDVAVYWGVKPQALTHWTVEKLDRIKAMARINFDRESCLLVQKIVESSMILQRQGRQCTLELLNDSVHVQLGDKTKRAAIADLGALERIILELDSHVKTGA